jgi:hypothetical protein
MSARVIPGLLATATSTDSAIHLKSAWLSHGLAQVILVVGLMLALDGLDSPWMGLIFPWKGRIFP